MKIYLICVHKNLWFKITFCSYGAAAGVRGLHGPDFSVQARPGPHGYNLGPMIEEKKNEDDEIKKKISARARPGPREKLKFRSQPGPARKGK